MKSRDGVHVRLKNRPMSKFVFTTSSSLSTEEEENWTFFLVNILTRPIPGPRCQTFVFPLKFESLIFSDSSSSSSPPKLITFSYLETLLINQWWSLNSSWFFSFHLPLILLLFKALRLNLNPFKIKLVVETHLSDTIKIKRHFRTNNHLTHILFSDRRRWQQSCLIRRGQVRK